MNILVIGNGFDLAHELPTKYTDFLDFCKIIRATYTAKMYEDIYRCWDSLSFKEKDNTKKIEALFTELFERRQVDKKAASGYVKERIASYDCFDEFYICIKDNLWIEYYEQNPIYQKENWIDFELEISKVIKSLDDDMCCGEGKKHILEDIIHSLSNSFLVKKYGEYTLTSQSTGPFLGQKPISITFREIRDVLYGDLNRLIRALEIYLANYVEELDCKLISPDMMNINFDKVLSFNYTNTYASLYDSKQKTECDYIHGKAELSHSIDTNNMVLGIDEYLAPDRRDKDVEFIAFKKFYQRIHKETGCKYKEWVDVIRKDANKKNGWIYENKDHSKDYRHYLYIFGHSLDVTDKDVLRELILNDNVYTTIFYLNKDVHGQQIANLVKVIGPDELIKRTGGSTKTIEFRVQKDMQRVE